MTLEINNGQDVMDSRDVLERVEELETEIEDLDGSESDLGDFVSLADDIEGLKAELKPIKAFADELTDATAEAIHGEPVIRDSFFTAYAQDLAEDVGVLPALTAWPMNCIDWDEAASELKVDYTEVEFDGVSYFIRS